MTERGTKELTKEYNVTEEELEEALTSHCPQCTELVQKTIRYRLQKMELEDKYKKICERFTTVINILDLPKDASFEDVKSVLEEVMQLKKSLG